MWELQPFHRAVLEGSTHTIGPHRTRKWRDCSEEQALSEDSLFVCSGQSASRRMGHILITVDYAPHLAQVIIIIVTLIVNVLFMHDTPWIQKKYLISYVQDQIAEVITKEWYA